jgi:hypothetical protein
MRRGMTGAEKLQVIQLAIESFVLQQLNVGSLFDDPPVIKDEYAIRPLDRRESMRNHEGRSTLH